MSAVELPQGSLFEITDHLQALFDSLEMVEDPALRREAEADIEKYLEAEVRKVDAVNGYLDMCGVQQQAARAEIQRLKDRIALWESREKRVRDYVQSVMERFGEKKLEGRTATFALRAAPSRVVVLDENLIPERFKRTTVTVELNKSALRKALSDGEDIPGADLSMGGHTLVRK